MNSNPTIAKRAASVPLCWLNTHINTMAEANIGNASNCLNVFIHGPGFGNMARDVGTNDKIKYGDARPKPSAVKKVILNIAGCVIA